MEITKLEKKDFYQHGEFYKLHIKTQRGLVVLNLEEEAYNTLRPEFKKVKNSGQFGEHVTYTN